MRLKFEIISNYKVWIKILLPPVFLLLVFYLLTGLNFLKEFGLLYLPISFGLIIGISNWRLFKFKINAYKPFLAIFTSILISIISFFLGVFSFGLYSILKNLLKVILEGDNTKFSIIIFSVCFIAPLSLFYLYRLIFIYAQNKTNFYIKLVAIVLLILYFIIHFIYFNEVNNFKLKSLFSPYVFWQVIMALALQLILYQKELKELFNPKKTS